MQYAKGPEVEGDVKQEEEPVSRGPAHDKMQALADRYHRANPHLSPARSYSDVYQDKANAELRDAVIAEQLNRERVPYRFTRTPAGHAVTVDMSNPDRLAHARAVRTQGP